MRRPNPSSAALIVVALALFTDTLLYYLLVPLLPGYARTYGLSQMGIGVLFGSYAVALLLGTVPLGKLADRVGRRGPMLWGLVGLGATTLLFAFSRSYPLLVLARVLQGLSATATWTAGMALLADHFPAERRGRAMGTVFAFANLGVLLGPPIAGFLSEHFGPRSPFLVAAALALLDALARAFLLEEVPRSAPATLGFTALLKQPTVRIFAGAMALGAGLWALLESTLPLHFDRVLGWKPGLIGLAFAAAAAAHMATSPLMGAASDRWGRRRILRIGLVMVMVLLPLPPLVRSVALVMVLMMGLGLTASFVMSPASPALADAVDRMGSSSYASVFGILNLSYALGMMGGPLLGSALVEGFGIQGSLTAMALVFGAYAWVVGRADPEGRAAR